MNKLPKVNRVEVINHTLPIEEGGGRAYTAYGDFNVSYDLQDNNRTMKIFLTDKNTMNKTIEDIISEFKEGMEGDSCCIDCKCSHINFLRNALMQVKQNALEDLKKRLPEKKSVKTGVQGVNDEAIGFNQCLDIVTQLIMKTTITKKEHKAGSPNSYDMGQWNNENKEKYSK